MMRSMQLGAAGLLVLGLGGCVVVPAQPLPPPPLVALPGPTKTAAQFQLDDVACRAAADSMENATSAPPAPAAPPPNRQARSSAAQVTDGRLAQNGVAAGTAPATPPTPGIVYLQCMVGQNNIVQPLAPVRPAYYGYYQAFPVYSGFGGYYPWLYGDRFGFYGGWGGGWGGYRGRWGGGFGGFRGGRW